MGEDSKFETLKVSRIIWPGPCLQRQKGHANTISINDFPARLRESNLQRCAHEPWSQDNGLENLHN